MTCCGRRPSPLVIALWVILTAVFAVTTGAAAQGTDASIIDEQIASIRAQVGDSRVICGLSGGVDSAVAAAVVQRAIGEDRILLTRDRHLIRDGQVSACAVAGSVSPKASRVAKAWFARNRITRPFAADRPAG